ncbi:MAG: DNA mismatch repair protein MutS [Candidatus Latescibacteria bacterium]|nr:DNA mismatch repair protein MutS [Candidatus Latescibacterota bacterium]
MEQYWRFKKEHPNAILLFRMGDFYETFYDDAKLASRLLGLTLTSRNHGRAESVPLAGVPHHALETYLARLIRAGQKVAICEQVENPKLAKGIVKRDVVQVVSPGTALSEDLLDQRRNNYLVGVVEGEGIAGLAVVDLSTGEFTIEEVPEVRFHEAFERFGASELVAPESWAGRRGADFAERFPGVLISRVEDWTASRAYAHDALTSHFAVASLQGFDCEDATAGVCAAGAVLTYLKANQQGAVPHITRLARRRSRDGMILDLSTQRNLELLGALQDGRREGSLLSILDRTRTAMGGRMLRAWLAGPLTDVARIERRLEAVEALVQNPKRREELRKTLDRIADLERLMAKICCRRANARDLVALRNSVRILPDLKRALDGLDADLFRVARETGLPDLADLEQFIAQAVADDPPAALTEGGLLRPGYSADLDELREISQNGRAWVARLQARERERTGIASLKVAFNKAFGYYIEVTNANLNRAPEDYVRKQTLVGGERFITPDLKEWESKILGADERAQELEYDLFQQVRDRVAGWVAPVQTAARTVAEVDTLAGFAEVAATNRYVRPGVEESDAIEICDGRHPVVETLLKEGEFVPNDTHLDCSKNQILIITGPNMSGKSTALRQVGLIVLLAQVGCFVPARSARIGVVDRIFTRVGASDNLARGESTFLVEMHEAANILNNATSRSLVLLDEIGRGTSTFDGLSIAWAMTEYLHSATPQKPRTLFATHYHELTELETILPRVQNFNVAVQEHGDRVIFLRKIVRGGCDHSYGIHVAQMAGMPPQVVARAREVLARLEENDLTLTKSTARASRRRKVFGDHPSLFAQGAEPGPSDVAPPPSLPAPHPVLEEIRALDVSRLTPLEALVKLDAWKKQVEEEGEGR